MYSSVETLPSTTMNKNIDHTLYDPSTRLFAGKYMLLHNHVSPFWSSGLFILTSMKVSKYKNKAGVALS